MGRIAAGLVFLFGFTGCGGTAETFTGLPTYQPGACVGIIVANHGSQGLHYDQCYAPIWRLEGQIWTQLTEGGVDCLLDYRAVSPGRRHGFWVTLPEDLSPGTYRLDVRLQWIGFIDGDEFVQPTAPFSVEGAPGPIDCSMEGFEPVQE